MKRILLFSFAVVAHAQTALLFDHVTLIDGTGRPAKADSCILTAAGKIERVGACPISAPPGAQTINGRGKFLIPGMMDVHIHLVGGRGGAQANNPARPGADQTAIRALHSYLYSGFTTVLDLGNIPDFIFRMRDLERSGKIVAPRILAAGGVVTCPGGHGSGNGATIVESWPQSKSALDAAIARQPDMVKITYDEHGWGTRPMIPLLPVDLMEQVIRYYNLHGIRSTVHISNEIRAEEAIFAGVDTLAHPVIQGPISDSFVRLMRAKLIPEATTLTIGDSYSRIAEHPEFVDTGLYKDTMEPAEAQRIKTTESAAQKQNRWAAWMKVMTPVCQENVRKLDAAGAIMALGTDQSSGPAGHRELELITGGGVPPLNAIRMATLNAARFLGRERDLGSIEEGKIADLVLLDADPIANIDNAKRVNLVVKNGEIIDRSKLDLPVNRK